MKIKNRYIYLFLIAILVRLILAAIFVDVFSWPTGSSKEYRIELAQSIESGKGFSYKGIPNLYQTPVYPFFLATIFFFFGCKWWAVALFQSILEGMSCIGISKLGEKISKEGWIAGFIYAFYPYSAMQSRSIVDTPVFVFVFIVSLLYFYKFTENFRLRNLLIGATLLGVGILNRPSIFVIVPAFIFYLIISKIRLKDMLRFTLIFVVITSLIPLVWIWRNYQLSGKFPVLSVGGQHFLWYGHNEHIYKILKRRESPDLIGKDTRYPMNPNFTVDDFFVLSPSEQVELGNECMNIAKKWVINNKNTVFKYTILKLKRFVSWEYIIRNQDRPLQDMRILIFRITNAPIVIFGWIGLALLLFKKRNTAIFFIIITVGFILIHIISNFESRHKIPLDALFITFIPISITYLIIAVKSLAKRIVKT